MTDPHWTEPERRTVTEDRVLLLVESAVSQSMAKHESRMTQHFDLHFKKVVELITAAFPDGDPHGHRMAHEKDIRDADSWRKIKAEVISKAATSGVLIALGWVALIIWGAFKDSVSK